VAGPGAPTSKEISGTSPASAAVAGLIAYFYGVPKYIDAIKDKYNGLPEDEQTGSQWVKTVRAFVQGMS